MPSTEEEPPTSPQLGPALDQGLLGQLRLMNHLPGTSRKRAPDTLGIPSPENLRQNTGHTLDQMRKWNCHFDGKGVYEFLERVQELQRAYQLTDQQLLRGFPELLRGDAQLWYRNCASSLTTWGDLERQIRSFYLSPGERRHLDQQISERRQGAREPIRAYTTALLTLLRRRGGFDHERVMETLYYNMKPELRLHIRLKEVSSPEELIQQVQEIEEVQAQMPRGPQSEARAQAKTSFRKGGMLLEMRAARARQIQMPQSAKKLCSWCEKEDVLTRDCPCPKPGNARRTGPTTLTTRSKESTPATPGPSSRSE